MAAVKTERKKGISSGDTLEYVKIAGIAYIGWRVLQFIGNFGKDTTTGHGEGTSHEGTGGRNCVYGNYANRSKPEGAYKVLADAIYGAVWGGFLGQFNEKDEAIANALMQCYTADDVELLICAYGVRGKGVLIEENFDLPITVEMYLDDDWKNIVNQDYANKGISIYWP